MVLNLLVSVLEYGQKNNILFLLNIMQAVNGTIIDFLISMAYWTQFGLFIMSVFHVQFYQIFGNDGSFNGSMIDSNTAVMNSSLYYPTNVPLSNQSFRNNVDDNIDYERYGNIEHMPSSEVENMHFLNTHQSNVQQIGSRSGSANANQLYFDERKSSSRFLLSSDPSPVHNYRSSSNSNVRNEPSFYGSADDILRRMKEQQSGVGLSPYSNGRSVGSVQRVFDGLSISHLMSDV